MSIRFKGTDLRSVLSETVANQCRVILVKDQRVYLRAERGGRRPDGGPEADRLSTPLVSAGQSVTMLRLPFLPRP